MSDYPVPQYKESLQLLWWLIHTHHDGKVEVPVEAFLEDRPRILSSKPVIERDALEVRAK